MQILRDLMEFMQTQPSEHILTSKYAKSILFAFTQSITLLLTIFPSFFKVWHTIFINLELNIFYSALQALVPSLVVVMNYVCFGVGLAGA